MEYKREIRSAVANGMGGNCGGGGSVGEVRNGKSNMGTVVVTKCPRLGGEDRMGVESVCNVETARQWA